MIAMIRRVEASLERYVERYPEMVLSSSEALKCAARSRVWLEEMLWISENELYGGPSPGPRTEAA